MPEATAPVVVDGQGTPPAVTSVTPPSATPPVTSVTPPAPAIPWLATADELTVGYVQNKGWKEPAQVLEGYRQLETLLGADRAGRSVVLPKPDAPKTEVDAFYNRLGRPADPAGYKLEVPKEGGDPEFAKAAATKMHELGFTQKQGETLGAWWNEQAQTQLAAQKQKKADDYTAGDAALKSKWGGAFTQELAKAQAAVRSFGITDAQIDALQESMGHQATMEFFNKIGAKVGEDTFVDGKGSGNNFGAAMTPAQAKARIADLKADKNWQERYFKGDADCKAEMNRLQNFAYPASS